MKEYEFRATYVRDGGGRKMDGTVRVEAESVVHAWVLAADQATNVAGQWTLDAVEFMGLV